MCKVHHHFILMHIQLVLFAFNSNTMKFHYLKQNLIIILKFQVVILYINSLRLCVCLYNTTILDFNSPAELAQHLVGRQVVVLVVQSYNVCLTGRARQGGQTFSITGRYLPARYLAVPIRNRARPGGQAKRLGKGCNAGGLELQCLSVCLFDRQGKAGQGGQTFSVTGRYLLARYLAVPIRNRAGQGRAGQGSKGRAGRPGKKTWEILGYGFQDMVFRTWDLNFGAWEILGYDFQDMVFRTWDLNFGAWIFTLAI